MSLLKKVYFDNAATTCVDERVREAMLPFYTDMFGNASSIHSYGTGVKVMLDKFRLGLSEKINARSDEIIFTSGGTESNNLALKGVAFSNMNKGNHIIISAIEHDSILNTCKWLETQGFYVSYLPVFESGIVDIEELQKLITPQTILVSIMHVNNEIGTIQPILEIGKICKKHDVYFHTDACQSFGKVPIDVISQNISLMSLNAHKIYGPKGVGGLYIKRGVKITPLLHGGGHEFGLRSTTENIPGIAGFCKAAEICINEFDEETKRMSALRNRLIDELQKNFEGIYFNGTFENRLPNNLNFAISGLEGETIRLLLMLDESGIAVSAGSACSNNDSSKSSSHVLQAIGRNQFESRGAIRVSPGRFTSEDDIDYFLEIFTDAIKKLNPIFSN
ncbi:MAG: cysteine desulfurase family protein [Bacteroidota bacterium]|nr:cysteine desulfurase family protein [Bacteroidota bacterium]